ncbi:MAG: site-2 protease family protein [Chlorobiaceae bacterium]
MNLSGRNYPLHAALFLVTVFTTLWAGAFWGGHPVTLSRAFPFVGNLGTGVAYSFALLSFLSVHEFGHYFAALHHRVRATLPYYIPVPPLPFFLSIGTMGAVIRIRERITNTSALFDIGMTGPVSGFLVCVAILVYGFTHLPPADFIYTIHPEYLAKGFVQAPPGETLLLGKNLLWITMERAIAPKNLPPMTEMYHYPFLFAGWLGSIVTALNLLPVGQLDGGHIIYAMFGRKGHTKAARGFVLFITLLAMPAFLQMAAAMLHLESAVVIPQLLLRWSWPGWLLWAFILSRVIGLHHPPTLLDHPLSAPRKVSGWIAITIFLLTFTPVPFATI